jgi:hypothetical protein
VWQPAFPFVFANKTPMFFCSYSIQHCKSYMMPTHVKTFMKYFVYFGVCVCVCVCCADSDAILAAATHHKTHVKKRQQWFDIIIKQFHVANRQP